MKWGEVMKIKSRKTRPRRVIILGAAGRDFHDFNMFFRGNPAYRVVAFTAAQIPGIAGRRYPAELAGKGYPRGIPIVAEEKMPELAAKHHVDVVVLAYSDLPHTEVMHKASAALAAGADFWLMGPQSTMLSSSKPVISVCAVRTGAGKSPVTRRIIDLLRELAPRLRVVVIRHPMPYGDLAEQAVQRFASTADLAKHKATIEEMEEYAPHIERGTIVYAGVDYERILRQAEKEADIIIWDGGNNDLSFVRPDLLITVADCRRPGHETSYHPGEANIRMADVIIANKADRAPLADVRTVLNNVKALNPKALVIKAVLSISVEDHETLRGKRVLVIEDGPTMTHGGLPTGAGFVAARRAGAHILDPRHYAVGSLKQVFKRYAHIGPVLPAMGYSKQQVRELEQTIQRTPCDVVIGATPIDLRLVLRTKKPVVRVRYELKEIGRQKLENFLVKKLRL